MNTLTARDLMTTDVLTVPPATPVVAVARMLADRGISAVPVLDAAGAVVGVITEADLIRRLAGEVDEKPGFLSRMFGDTGAQAERYARTHGATAADIMTREVVSAPPETPAAKLAHLLEDRHIRRVFIMEGGRLLGLVSRADLLRAIVATPPTAVTADDARIRADVMTAMRREPWADYVHTAVEVKGGIVELYGYVRTDEVRRGLVVLAGEVAGVKGVTDRTEPLPVHLYPGMAY